MLWSTFRQQPPAAEVGRLRRQPAAEQQHRIRLRRDDDVHQRRHRARAATPPARRRPESSATPNPTNGSVHVALAASVSDVATGGANVDRRRVPNRRWNAAAMTRATFGTPTVSVNATILAATVNGLDTGSHTISVRGQDSLGNWGAWNSTTLNVVRSDTAGPVTTGPSADPQPTNGRQRGASRYRRPTPPPAAQPSPPASTSSTQSVQTAPARR